MENDNTSSVSVDAPPTAYHNRLLEALPESDYLRLLPELEPVTFELRQVLFEPGADITHVYFPSSGMASLVNDMKDGTVEVGTIGNEGMVGTPILLHASKLPMRAFIQLAGEGHRIPSEPFLRVVRDSPAAERLFLRYVQTQFDHLAQWVACNRLHTLDARCARWLLMSEDRAHSSQFLLTQEFLSYMLGVHRPAVSIAASALSDAGLIRYTRGKVTIVDRAGLETAACECYGITRRATDSLFADFTG
ncbi:MAG: Crp/Fnr family transcriptional regulator [bacterium]